MRKRRTTQMRVDLDTKAKIDKLRFDLTSIQGKEIKTPELFRRTFNIPNIENVLKNDADKKRRFKL